MVAQHTPTHNTLTRCLQSQQTNFKQISSIVKKYFNRIQVDFHVLSVCCLSLQAK